MGIILRRQSEMARVVSGVPCPFHSTQCKTADQRFLRHPLHFAQQLLDFFWTHLITGMNMVTEIIDKCAKLPDLFLIRLFMCTV